MATIQNHWIEPPDNIDLTNGTVTGDTTIPVWEWGSTHLLEWSTSYEFFNLFLVQDLRPNPEDTILTNVTNSTSFYWTVSTDVIELGISRTCWFKLHTIASEGDTFFESAAFNISGGPSWPASELSSTTVPPTSSSSPIPTQTLTSTLTLIPTLVSAPAPSTLSPSTLSTPTTTSPALPSSDPSTTTPHTSSQLIIELALGISIPLLLIAGLLIAWKVRSRRRISLPPKAAGSSIAEMAAEDAGFGVKEMAASQVHELFGPMSRSALENNARWEMEDNARWEMEDNARWEMEDNPRWEMDA
ncbi:hypothetical protein MMC27_005719 [Xylographa pallens]|nr:hypothetical protein [Xylographa pallens]